MKSSFDFFSAWLPLIIAILASVVALYQIRLNNITNSRLKWLDGLKVFISDFISESEMILLNKMASGSIENRAKEQSIPKNAIDFIEKVNADLPLQLKSIEAKYILIKLNLNPKEDLHIKFEEALELYMDQFNKIPLVKNDKDESINLIQTMRKQNECLILLARNLMKLEWEKIKKSELNYFLYSHFGKGKILLKESLKIGNK